jgi:xanthine dehydrogenase large subunit
VLMRAMVHVDNAYFLPAAHITGRLARTHKTSNTAFRGFGGPQGMLIAEEVMARIAQALKLPAHVVRERNLYAALGDRNITHYGQVIHDHRISRLWAQLLQQSDFAKRQQLVTAHNHAHATKKRGIAITPVKFGISFNKVQYNQAGALVLVYSDGSVQLNHGGTEMGQGLHSKMLVVAQRALGVSTTRLRMMPTATDKVPNTSATAASSGSDLNGQALKAACDTITASMKSCVITGNCRRTRR